ncbi:MAG: 3-hydroxyacyl-CoA dehydrogenase NAD-binding domain-containing protein [Bacteroidetes bacterium]|nr:3-hydroxyacyl-CoA dehydrogenase NAD-binding domain-containing protein [Bacteroidota bacterium]
MKLINSVAVIGSGTMGAGIAQVCAQAGVSVFLFDVNEDALLKAKSNIANSYTQAVQKNKITEVEMTASLARIKFTNHFTDLVADLCIEAIVEKLDVKRDLLQRLAAQNLPQCILASNTSSIPITQIAALVPFPERVVGIHFFNPAHLMKLVEVIAGAETSTEVVETAKVFVAKLGKTAVTAKDAPGFIVNRVARHYYVEALKILEENVSSFENIDLLMEASGFKMGPFRLMDLIGIDTNYSVTSSIYEQFAYDSKFRPSRIQKQKVDAGHWGKKRGFGFYKYE